MDTYICVLFGVQQNLLDSMLFGEAVVSAVVLHQKDPWFKSWLAIFMYGITGLDQACVGSLHVFWLPPTVQNMSAVILNFPLL